MKLKKIRNALLVVLTLALVSATTVAITWAATNAKFTEKENKFTSNPDISLQFSEPTFDAIDFGYERGDEDANVPEKDEPITDDETHVIPALPNGTSITSANDLGYHKARGYLANQFIPKDPKLKNNSSNDLADKETDTKKKNNGTTSDEWVAFGVKYSMTIPTDEVFELDVTKNNTGKDGSTQAKAYLVSALPATSATGAYKGATVEFPSYANFASTIATVRYKGASQNGDPAENDTTDGIRKSATPDEDHETWKDISTDGSGTRYMYNKKLPATSTDDANITKALFDYVWINNITEVFTTTNETTYTKYYKIDVTGKVGNNTLTSKSIFVSSLPDFKIELTGYAIQADNVLYTNAPTELNAFIDSKA